MLKSLDAEHLLRAHALLASHHKRFQMQKRSLEQGAGSSVLFHLDEIITIRAAASRLSRSAEDYSLNGARVAAERVITVLASFSGDVYLSRDDLTMVIDALVIALNGFTDSMSGQNIFVMTGNSHTRITAAEAGFGQDVDDAFPSAVYDVREAHMCLAFERWTAAVMHLMRSLEVALNALANRYGVNSGENWNTLLNQLEARLRQVSKSKDGEADEQFAAEAAVHFRLLKNAWRNHAQHSKAMYDEARADAIYHSVRALMIHLSGRLSE